MKLFQKTIIHLFSLYSRMFPKQAGKLALRLFQRPGKQKIRTREIPFYHEGHKLSVHTHQGLVSCYTFGSPEKQPVILIHGWNSHPGSLYAIASALKNEAYVISITLPGHHDSAKNWTNLYDSAQTIREVLNQLKLSDPPSIIAHSFGSAVTTKALSTSGYKVKNLVYVTSPNKMMDVFQDYKKMIRLSDASFDHLVALTVKQIGSIQHANMEDLLSRVDYESLTMLHDLEDRVIPFENSQRMVAKNANATLVPVSNMGHYRILWNPELIEMIRVQVLDPQKQPVLAMK